MIKLHCVASLCDSCVHSPECILPAVPGSPVFECNEHLHVLAVAWGTTRGEGARGTILSSHIGDRASLCDSCESHAACTLRTSDGSASQGEVDPAV
jgi:hypothetical protein